MITAIIPLMLLVQADSLTAMLQDAAASDDMPQLLTLSLEVCRTGKTDGQKADGYMYAGYAYGMMHRPDSSEICFSEALDIAERCRDRLGTATIYNCKGLVALNADADYYSAIQAFDKGLQAAEDHQDSEIYSVLLGNIAYTSNLRGDPEGIGYAEECYRRGTESGNIFLTYIGAYTLAMFHYSAGEYSKALPYIRRAGEITGMKGRADGAGISDIDKAACNNLHGKICLAMNETGTAKEYLDSALAICTKSSQPCDMANVYLSLGLYYRQKNQPDSALAMYRAGIAAAEDIHDMVHMKDLYKYISDIYAEKGDWHQALEYYRKFHTQTVEMFDSEKERAMSELKVKYETLQKEHEIQEHIIKIQKQRKRIIFLLSGLLLTVMVFSGIIYLYRKRNMYYLQIVRQTQESLKAREELEAARQQMTDSRHKYSSSSLSESMGDELFGRLEKIMREQKIYCDRELTLTRLAEMLGTNRSYMSQLINQHTGMNYSAYINRYRIEEAIRMVSDTDIPLKAIAFDLGFTSLATFYTYFKKEIGLPPSQYREKLISLKNKSQEE